MMRDCHSRTVYAWTTPFDEGTFSALTRRLMARPDAVLLVAEDESGVCGMAAALCYPHWWNRYHLTGQELLWWVDEAKRRTRAGTLLFSGLEDWVRHKGLRTFLTAAAISFTPDSVRRFYKRRGYRPNEVIYTKEM